MTNKRGRKGKYESHVKPYLPLIAEMCRTMTESQIAESLGISYSTFNQYKIDYPELTETIKKGKQNLVSELRSSLIEKANGFSKIVKRAMKCKTVDYENGKRLREEEKVIFYDEEIYFPPDVAALNLALKNYDRENWANDPQAIEIKKKELELREKQIENNAW